jgi:hypothetical protein
MLAAARYNVGLDQDLRAAPPGAPAPSAQGSTNAAMTSQSAPSWRQQRCSDARHESSLP